MADDSRMRWLPPGEVPTLGNWFRAAGLRHPLRRQVAHQPRRPARPGHRQAAGHQRRRRRRRSPPPSTPTSTPTRWAPTASPAGSAPSRTAPAWPTAACVRDPLIADRVVAWLEDRYARRRAGDADALRPFLLVASFVNPHDIVLFPVWVRSQAPRRRALAARPAARARGPDRSTRTCATKPAAQIAYREAYPSGYGPAPAVARIYRPNAQRYRDLYYRLHAEVDGPVDRVRRAVTEGRLGRRRARAHRRPRRAARRPRRPAPEVVQPLRRGHPGPVHHRPHRRPARPPRRRIDGTRPRTSTWSRRCSPPPGSTSRRWRRTCARDVHRGAPAARRRPDAAWSTGTAPAERRPGRLPHDPGQHARGRHRRLRRGPPPRADRPPAGPAAHPGARPRRRRTSRAWSPGWPTPTPAAVPATCGSSSAPSTTRPPGPSPGSDTWPPTGPAGPAYRTEPLPDQWELYDLDADPDRGRQPGGRPRRRPRSSPTSAVG